MAVPANATWLAVDNGLATELAELLQIAAYAWFVIMDETLKSGAGSRLNPSMAVSISAAQFRRGNRT